MKVLTNAQRDQFWKEGVLLVENAISSEQLLALRNQFNEWVEESKGQTEAYGRTIDGRSRFDVQPGHNAETPGLRRVNAPTEVSDAYFDVMKNSRMVDMVADLIGPNVRHHHNKINSKLPGTMTKVDWHQDFPFTPHSNTDLVTALLMIDDVTEENGPLEVVKGSHKGPLHTLWHDGVFTGAVSTDTTANCQKNATRCTGPAGAACFMHTSMLHGSTENFSDQPRTLFITVYAAADAVPCSPNPVPNKHQGLIVSGEDPQTIRAMDFRIETPEYPDGASFFAQQAEDERTTP